MDPELEQMVLRFYRLGVKHGTEEGKLRALIEMTKSGEISRWKRPSHGFPFDLLTAMIQGALTLVERIVQRRVNRTLDFLNRLRKR